MPTLWFAKDGRRPDTQSGPGISVTLDEIDVIFQNVRFHFAGEDAPDINPDSPSDSIKNVVIEVTAGDCGSERLPQAGFYLVEGVSPHSIERALLKQRER